MSLKKGETIFLSLLLFFSHRQKSHATHKLRGVREKALGEKISGTVFGWTSVNCDRPMAIQRRPLTNNCLRWLQTRSQICLP